MTPERDLPSVDSVVRRLEHLTDLPPNLIVSEIRAVLAERRAAIREEKGFDSRPVEQLVEERLRTLLKPSLRQVINASGVILHTNLGRAPLSHFQHISRYSNLEYDLVRANAESATPILRPYSNDCSDAMPSSSITMRRRCIWS